MNDITYDDLDVLALQFTLWALLMIGAVLLATRSCGTAPRQRHDRPKAAR